MKSLVLSFSESKVLVAQKLKEILCKKGYVVYTTDNLQGNLAKDEAYLTKLFHSDAFLIINSPDYTLSENYFITFLESRCSSQRDTQVIVL